MRGVERKQPPRTHSTASTVNTHICLTLSKPQRNKTERLVSSTGTDRAQRWGRHKPRHQRAAQHSRGAARVSSWGGTQRGRAAGER